MVQFSALRGLPTGTSVTPRDTSNALRHHVPFAGTIQREMEAVVDALGTEDALETQLLDGFDRAIHEQPDAVGAGVDLVAIMAVDPTFDAFTFRSLARETFLKVREARGARAPHECDGLLSPAMEHEINTVIDGDVASHRHHILSQLEVRDATILSASVEDGREKIAMHFVVVAEGIERDADTEAVLADTHTTQQWPELWQFERDPTVDPTATDQQHALSFGPAAWMFAHRGWVVTDIKRLDA